jgi:hypothetical protein
MIRTAASEPSISQMVQASERQMDAFWQAQLRS